MFSATCAELARFGSLVMRILLLYRRFISCEFVTECVFKTGYSDSWGILARKVSLLCKGSILDMRVWYGLRAED